LGRGRGKGCVGFKKAGGQREMCSKAKRGGRRVSPEPEIWGIPTRGQREEEMIETPR